MKKLSILISALLIYCTSITGQTILSGDISGILDIEGTPYILIDDCTVQSGNELIIEQGVELVIGDSMSLNIYGKILAEGTSDQHIIFRAVNNNAKFKRVYLQNGSSDPPISEFRYCEFMNAQIGLYIHAIGRINNAYTTLQTVVSNCSFDSTVSTAIYARAQAVDASIWLTARRRHASVNPIIDGCIFNGTGVGIEFIMQGAGSSYYSNGNTAAIIQNNAFLNLPGSAISMMPGSGPSHSGTPSFINNTIVNCERGIWIQDGDFDATTINNIFHSTDTAIERTGNSSSSTFYNCFYANSINFVGYPATYGDIVLTNANGDPCDLGFNIFQDPLFEISTDYILSTDSPCIEAGTDSLNQAISPPYDIEGNLRPNPTNTKPDIGAWESDYPVGIDDNYIAIMSENITLEQNYPNPFKQTTTISFNLPLASQVEICVYNSHGQKVVELLDDNKPAGYYSVNFDGSNFSSGVYYYKIKAGKFEAMRKMILSN